MSKLTKKQEMFCQEYLVNLNATQAAIRAGYSVRSANMQGGRMIVKDSIQGYLKQLMDKRTNRLELKADKILEEIASIEDDLDTIKERMKLLDDSTPICKKVESLINESNKIKDLAEKTKEAEDVQS